MEFTEGHQYYVSPFRFKNGMPPKAKFFIVLKELESGGVIGVMPSSRIKPCVQDVDTSGRGVVKAADGSAVAYSLPVGEPYTDYGWIPKRNAFIYAESARYYSDVRLRDILEGASFIIDNGAVDESILKDVRKMACQKGIGEDKARAMLLGEAPKTGNAFSRVTDDDLSVLGLTSRQKGDLRKNGVFLFEKPSLPGGKVMLVNAGGNVTVLTAGGRMLGTLSDFLRPREMALTRMIRPSSGPAPHDGEWPAGVLNPYVQQESAIEWLSRHLGDGTSFDRQSMYHLNIVNSLINHEKEIFKRFPSSYFGGLPEGGRRNVAASVILRAKAGSGGEKQHEIGASGYTREQELVGNWAERDGCWQDYAEQSQLDSGRKKLAFGSEARVFADDGKYVYKTVDLSHCRTLEAALDRVSLHNAIFPETAMVVEGFGMRDNAEDSSGYVLIVRQPFVQGENMLGPESGPYVQEQLHERTFDLVKPVPTPSEIAGALARGEKVPEYAQTVWCFSSQDKSVLLFDLHDENFVFDRKGHILVYDCEIKLNDDPHFGGPYQVPQVEFSEDAVGEIGAFLEDLVPRVRNREAFIRMYHTGDNHLREQLRETGRYDGTIEGPFPDDRWLVSVNPENREEVLLLPQRNVRLMLSLLQSGEFTAEEKADLARGRGIRKGGAFLAFDLDKGRVAEARQRKIRLARTVTVQRDAPQEKKPAAPKMRF